MDGSITIAGNDGCNVGEQSGGVVGNDSALVIGVIIDVAAGEGAGHIFGVGVPIEKDLIVDIVDLSGPFVEPHSLLIVVGEVVRLLNGDTDGV